MIVSDGVGLSPKGEGEPVPPSKATTGRHSQLSTVVCNGSSVMVSVSVSDTIRLLSLK